MRPLEEWARIIGTTPPRPEVVDPLWCEFDMVVAAPAIHEATAQERER